jgi:hypothetical protein
MCNSPLISYLLLYQYKQKIPETPCKEAGRKGFNHFKRNWICDGGGDDLTTAPLDINRRRDSYTIFFNWYSGDGVQLGPLGTAATNRPIVPAPGDYVDGEIGGMISKGYRSTRRKPAPVQLCPPRTPHTAWTRTRAAAVGSQRLTTWATARRDCYTI